jgi:protein tyrosine/serine phosphatase
MTAAVPPTPPRWQRRLRVLLLLALLPTLALGIFVLTLIVHHNFHVVSPGIIYRSAQMSGDALAATIREHGIKSVLNLRGAADGEAWYSAEVTTSARFGVVHFDFPLSATRELKDSDMDEILDTIDHAPKPMLIHCKSGADRTGLVGALYLYSIEGKSAADADRQLNPFYGHLPHLLWAGTSAMDKSFWRYVSEHAQAPHSPVISNAPALASRSSPD